MSDWFSEAISLYFCLDQFCFSWSRKLQRRWSPWIGLCRQSPLLMLTEYRYGIYFHIGNHFKIMSLHPGSSDGSDPSSPRETSVVKTTRSNLPSSCWTGTSIGQSKGEQVKWRNFLKFSNCTTNPKCNWSIGSSCASWVVRVRAPPTVSVW